MAKLYVIATPIGNMEDISLRAMRLLSELQALACEDTRVTKKIFQRYEIPFPETMFSYHDHNEEKSGAGILSLLNSGVDVGVCSDGGCPTISDPGYKIINAAFEAGHEVEAIPGPCAVETAIMASGMPSSSYTFLGFAPPKTGKRKNFFLKEFDSPHTLVFYESPYRVDKFLNDAYEIFGNRQAAVCIELTKKFQRISRGWLEDVAQEYNGKKVKGEIVIIIAGNNKKFIRQENDNDS